MEKDELRDRIQGRCLELCDEDEWDPAEYRLALLVSIDAYSTTIGSITKERMMAFTEEIIRMRGLVRPEGR